MKQMWAPWRITYIEQDFNVKSKQKKNRCFLCIQDAKLDDRNFILYRGKYSFIIMNHYPYNAGHLLIAPYRHIGQVEKITQDEVSEIFLLVQKSIIAMKKAYSPEGYNIGLNIGKVAGAGVPGHLHVHLIPRWLGDTNFMPIMTDTKVINEELENMYSKLKKLM